MEKSGLDAEQWLDEKLKPWSADTGIKPDVLWLPHDARNKTFQSRHTVVEQFLRSNWAHEVKLVPKTSVQDRINAARMIVPKCEFNEILCLDGIRALENWQYVWDEDRRTFSQTPDHNWASHGADAFTYGAQVVRDYVVPKKPQPRDEHGNIMMRMPEYTLEDLWDTAPKPESSRCT